MERWYRAIEKRCSIRAYKSEPSQTELDELRKAANSLSAHGVRIEIAKSNKVFASRLGGKVKGTDCFAAFISQAGRSEYVGYIGELFVLECVARGFGTCWIGASFRMGAAQKVVELDMGEGILCVTPVGRAAEPFKLRPRQSVSALTGLTVQDFVQLPKWQQCAVEAARRAPSAVNAQPWAFEIGDGCLSIVNTSSNLGYGKLDCGIAMIHLELGAAHCGVTGDWNLEGNTMTFVAHDILD